MYPSLLAQYVGCASYPCEAAARGAIERLAPLIGEFIGSQLLVSRVSINGKHAVVALALGMLPESAEKQVEALLSLPPGERIELHSNVVGTLVQYQMWRISQLVGEPDGVRHEVVNRRFEVDI